MQVTRAGQRDAPRIPIRVTLAIVASSLAWVFIADGHDIPNARVDRSIQVDIGPRRLRIDYELGLSELTLTQDLRALIGALPGVDRRGWFDRYGKVVGPLNAAGLVVTIDGRNLAIRTQGFDLAIEDHLRYTFHFEAELPTRGRLVVRDTNYGAGEGTSRLAIRGTGGVAVRGDDLPGDVHRIAIRAPWQMKGTEEKRTRHVEVEFGLGGVSGKTVADGPDFAQTGSPPGMAAGSAADGLSRLLDRSEISGLGLVLIAFSLGAAHAIQPGHGKSLVAAVSIGERGRWHRGLALALVITVAHMGGVMTVGLGLWLTGATSYVEINRILARAAGFVIAAIGVWRLGRHIGGHGEHDGGEWGEVGDDGGQNTANPQGLVALGLAGGMVPCWDAVVLILLAEAVDRLGLGLALLAAFSLGMATVLVAVGVIAAQFRGMVGRSSRGETWTRRLGLLGAAAITTIGLYLMAS